LIKNALTVDVIDQSARIGCVTRSKKLHPKTRAVRQHFTGFVFSALLIFPNNLCCSSVSKLKIQYK